MKSLVDGSPLAGSAVIQQISEELKHNVLAPAKEEARQIVADAQAEAQKIKAKAHLEAEQTLSAARGQVEKEKKAFEAGLKQASRQAVDNLKLAIEKELFNPALHKKVADAMAAPDVIGKLISAVLGALAKEGLSTNVALILPEAVSPDAVFAALTPSLNQTLRQGKVLKGKFSGGAKLQLEGKGITVDISEEAIIELLSHYRDDFRKALFGKEV